MPDPFTDRLLQQIAAHNANVPLLAYIRKLKSPAQMAAELT